MQRIEQRRQNLPVSLWSFEIPKDLILCAKTLLDYFIEVKLALGPPPLGMEESDDEAPYDYHRIRRILELPTGNVTPSQITQAHIPSRIDERYTQESALKLMRDIELLGLGELSDSSKAGRPTTILHKRKLDTLGQEKQDLLLKRIKVDKDKYTTC